MIANSQATKNPLSPTSAAIVKSFAAITPGESHCVTGASAKKPKIDMFIAVSLLVSSRSVLRPLIARRDRQRNGYRFLPAGLRHTRNHSLRSKLAECEARHLEATNKRSAAARHFAAVHHSRRAGVAWKLSQTGVILFRFELGAERGVFLHRLALALITINPGHLCHKERAI